MIWFIIPWHSQMISDQPGLSSVRVLLVQVSHNSPYLWCFLLVTFNGLPPILPLGYEVQFTHIVLKVEPNLSLPMQNPTVMVVSLLLQSLIKSAFPSLRSEFFFFNSSNKNKLPHYFEKTCVIQFRKPGNSASNLFSPYKAEHIWRLQSRFLNPTNTGKNQA